MKKMMTVFALSLFLAACSQNKTEVVSQQMDKELYPEQPVAAVAPVVESTQKYSGYTIQVLALVKGSDVNGYVHQLPKGYPLFVNNNKSVKGTTWRTLLMGQFKTESEAKKAMTSLSSTVKRQHPFVSSFNSIQHAGSDIVKIR